MRRLATLFTVLLVGSIAGAKDKPRVTVQVVDTQTSAREIAQTVAGRPAVSQTTCNESGNQTIYAKDNGRAVKGVVDTNKSSTCTTVAQPAVPPTTQVRSIRQENSQAVMADGTRVTLWCQQGLRKCVSLQPGSYSAEVDGNTVWIFIRDLSGNETKVKFKAVSVEPNAAPSKQDGA
jgi:hypothetical protein